MQIYRSAHSDFWNLSIRRDKQAEKFSAKPTRWFETLGFHEDRVICNPRDLAKYVSKIRYVNRLLAFIFATDECFKKLLEMPKVHAFLCRAAWAACVREVAWNAEVGCKWIPWHLSGFGLCLKVRWIGSFSKLNDFKVSICVQEHIAHAYLNLEDSAQKCASIPIVQFCSCRSIT